LWFWIEVGRFNSPERWLPGILERPTASSEDGKAPRLRLRIRANLSWARQSYLPKPSRFTCAVCKALQVPHLDLVRVGPRRVQKLCRRKVYRGDLMGGYSLYIPESANVSRGGYIGQSARVVGQFE
jgi:hypothetical protein